MDRGGHIQELKAEIEALKSENKTLRAVVDRYKATLEIIRDAGFKPVAGLEPVDQAYRRLAALALKDQE